MSIANGQVDFKYGAPKPTLEYGAIALTPAGELYAGDSAGNAIPAKPITATNLEAQAGITTDLRSWSPALVKMAAASAGTSDFQKILTGRFL